LDTRPTGSTGAGGGPDRDGILRVSASEAVMMSFVPLPVGAWGTVSFLKQLGHSVVRPASSARA